jgi:hypothetical protein
MKAAVDSGKGLPNHKRLGLPTLEDKILHHHHHTLSTHSLHYHSASSFKFTWKHFPLINMQFNNVIAASILAFAAVGHGSPVPAASAIDSALEGYIHGGGIEVGHADGDVV